MGPRHPGAPVIPVIIAPAYNRMDLLERMLRSIDEPVERGLVIDNARTGYTLPDDLASYHVFAPPFASLGYPGSINFGIAQTSDAPWWLFASNDVVFGPGDLAAIAQLMTERPVIVTNDYSWGALNHACVEAVGLFDEWSFHPLYFDDQDYAVRCRRGGVEWIRYTGGITQGADGHGASLTIHSDDRARAENSRSWALNEAAYVAKWGGPIGKERYETPWDLGLLWATKPDLAGRAARTWR